MITFSPQEEYALAKEQCPWDTAVVAKQAGVVEYMSEHLLEQFPKFRTAATAILAGKSPEERIDEHMRDCRRCQWVWKQTSMDTKDVPTIEDLQRMADEANGTSLSPGDAHN